MSDETLRVPHIKPSWVERNRKLVWVLAGVFVVVGFGLYVWFIVHTVGGAFRGSPPFEMAVQRLERCGECVRKLGRPLDTSGFVMGEINQTGSGGRAKLRRIARRPSQDRRPSRGIRLSSMTRDACATAVGRPRAPICGTSRSPGGRRTPRAAA